jgi:proline dehydrogenase
MTTITRKLLSPCAPLLTKAARAYVTGPELSDAMNTAYCLARRGAASTLCFWDSVDDSKERVAGMYSRTIRALACSDINSYVSIKAPSLNFDPILFSTILDETQCERIRIHFDALAWDSVEATFQMIERVQAHHPFLGCTLPGRWLRSVTDADRAVALRLSVRVVKGQWPDPKAPNRDMRSGFLEVVDALAGRARHVAVATHDPLLAVSAFERLRETNTSCELELLFGLPDREVVERTRVFEVPVRYYLPFGHAWLPYALGKAKRNPRILWWVIRDCLFGRRASSLFAAPLSGKSHVAS